MGRNRHHAEALAKAPRFLMKKSARPLKKCWDRHARAETLVDSTRVGHGQRVPVPTFSQLAVQHGHVKGKRRFPRTPERSFLRRSRWLPSPRFAGERFANGPTRQLTAAPAHSDILEDSCRLTRLLGEPVENICCRPLDANIRGV
jgi:hypothetical protein